MKLDNVAPEIGVVHDPSEYHWYEIGPVPPLACEVRVMD